MFAWLDFCCSVPHPSSDKMFLYQASKFKQNILNRGFYKGKKARLVICEDTIFHLLNHK